MTATDDRVIPDPWGSSPPPWDETPVPWQPGFRCALHGDGVQRGCPSCPPDDHPLQERR